MIAEPMETIPEISRLALWKGVHIWIYVGRVRERSTGRKVQPSKDVGTGPGLDARGQLQNMDYK